MRLPYGAVARLPRPMPSSLPPSPVLPVLLRLRDGLRIDVIALREIAIRQGSRTAAYCPLLATQSARPNHEILDFPELLHEPDQIDDVRHRLRRMRPYTASNLLVVDGQRNGRPSLNDAVQFREIESEPEYGHVGADANPAGSEVSDDLRTLLRWCFCCDVGRARNRRRQFPRLINEPREDEHVLPASVELPLHFVAEPPDEPDLREDLLHARASIVRAGRVNL